jgi:uncharacterized membrane protein
MIHSSYFVETMQAVGILALISLWVLVMLCGMSYFAAKMPDAPSPSRWKPTFMRLGTVLFLAAVGKLIAERNGVHPSYQTWVILSGALAGIVVDFTWRFVTRRIVSRGKT